LVKGKRSEKYARSGEGRALAEEILQGPLEISTLRGIPEHLVWGNAARWTRQLLLVAWLLDIVKLEWLAIGSL
jgi:hypothetical protein